MYKVSLPLTLCCSKANSPCLLVINFCCKQEGIKEKKKKNQKTYFLFGPLLAWRELFVSQREKKRNNERIQVYT
jgi:hypothetical protein